MAIVPVDIYVKEPAPGSDPIESVLVRIYSADGSTLITESTTDVDGHAGFLLESDPYQLRLFKFQVAFSQPQSLEVSDVEPNVFDVVGTIVTPPVASDPNLCRVSGYIRQLNGSVAPGIMIYLENLQTPLLLAGSPILPESMRFRSDRTGYVEFDLIRTAVYEATLVGQSDTVRRITVPDTSSVALGALLFPVVSSISLSPSSPTLASGGSLVVTPTVLLSNGNSLVGSGQRDVLWSSSDEDIFTVNVGETTLELVGRAAGTAELRATRKDVTIVGVPELTISGQPVTVTVT